MRLNLSATVSSTVIAVVAASLLAGCASNSSQLIVDRKGVDPVQYGNDLAECQAYSGEVQVGRTIGTGAAGGAIVGGAIGAIVGDHKSAERMASVGAVTGAAKGTATSMKEKQAVVRRCMAGRGYRVLN